MNFNNILKDSLWNDFMPSFLYTVFVRFWYIWVLGIAFLIVKGIVKKNRKGK